MYKISVTVLVIFIKSHPFFLLQGKRSNLIYLICWHILFYLTSFKSQLGCWICFKITCWFYYSARVISESSEIVRTLQFLYNYKVNTFYLWNTQLNKQEFLLLRTTYTHTNQLLLNKHLISQQVYQCIPCRVWSDCAQTSDFTKTFFE